MLTGFVKRAGRILPGYYTVRRFVRQQRDAKEAARWEAMGRVGPPPHLVKQRMLIEYVRAYELRVFIETGTYYGDMVEAMTPFVERVVSIELSRELFEASRRRFHGDPKVRLLHGDSGQQLGDVVRCLDQPALFWLDGHFSAGETARGGRETPIFDELAHILPSSLPHVIAIDDARCFGSARGYPTLDELQHFVRARRRDLAITVDRDCIQITPDRPHGSERSRSASAIV